MNYFTRTNSRLVFWTLALIAIVLVWSNGAGNMLAQAQDAADAAADADTDAGADAGVDADAGADEKAGDAEGDTDEPQDQEEEEDAQSLGQLIFKRPEATSEWVGLGFYIVLFIFSIAALTVTFERAFNLTRGKVMPNAFVRRLRDELRVGRVTADDLRVVSESSSAPIAKILKGGVLRGGRPLLEVEKGMEDAAAREVAAIRARNRPLNVIGNVAPLVGLLGTVVGMIFAFQVASQAGLQKAELLSKGIYVALLTTAGGLTIAIPCLLIVAVYNTRIDRIIREIDECLLETLPSFADMEAPAATPSSQSGIPSPADAPS